MADTTTAAVLPIFRSHYSLGGSILTLQEPGKAKPGNPLSVFDLAARAKMDAVHLWDHRLDGFLEAYKSAQKAKVKLCFGLTLTICADHKDKDPETRRTESAVTILVLNAKGYSDLIRIWNRAWCDGSFTFRDNTYGRADWRLLKEYWTENLGLVLPYFSSFLAKNTLTTNVVTPELPVTPWLTMEVDSRLPFAPLLDAAVLRYQSGGNPTKGLLKVKTICYEGDDTGLSFKAYQTFRAIHTGGTFDAPEVNHFASNRFSFKAWQELVAKPIGA